MSESKWHQYPYHSLVACDCEDGKHQSQHWSSLGHLNSLEQQLAEVKAESARLREALRDIATTGGHGVLHDVLSNKARHALQAHARGEET